MNLGCDFLLTLLFLCLVHHSAEANTCSLFKYVSLGESVGFPFSQISNPECGLARINCTTAKPKEKFQQMVNIMHEKGEKDSIDSGPLATTFGVNKRGCTRCVSSVISRRAILAFSFATHLLQEIDDERHNLNATMGSLHKDNADLKEQVKELVEGLKNGTYDAHRRNQTPSYVPSTSGGSRQDSTGLSNTLPAEIRCAIHSHYGDIVGYGIKNPLGIGTVHGYTLKPDEARVCIEKIVDPAYQLWGGKQFGLTTLGEVDVGSFIY